jgi:DNA helicase IV
MAAQLIITTSKQDFTTIATNIINRAKKQGNDRVVFVDTSADPVQVMDTDSASKSISKMQKFYKQVGTYNQACLNEYLTEDLEWCTRNNK